MLVWSAGLALCWGVVVTGVKRLLTKHRVDQLHKLPEKETVT